MAERQHSLEALFQEAEEIIERIIRKKFRVSLAAADGGAENQNALEFSQQVKMLVWAKLSTEGGETIRDVRSYAAVLTYNQFSERIRQENPEWNSLKNRLRYYLNESGGSAVWQNDPSEWLCGYTSWRGQKQTWLDADKMKMIAEDPFSVLPRPLAGKNIRQLKKRDWDEMIEAIFDHLGSPVELDDLVHLVGAAFDVDDIEPQSLSASEEAGASTPLAQPRWAGQSPETDALQREYLETLWREICQLRPNQRLAYLLNFRDADGDLEIFTLHGVAGSVEIGRVLQLSEEQFERAWEGLPLEAAAKEDYRSLASYDEKFAALSRHIPLDDLLIARLLGGERQQVINLRRLARDRLARRMEGFK